MRIVPTYNTLPPPEYSIEKKYISNRHKDYPKW